MEAYWLLIYMAIVVDFCDGSEKLLFSKLFKNYNPSPRPTYSANEPISVRFGVALNQILDLDEKKQTLTTSLWVTEVCGGHTLHYERTYPFIKFYDVSALYLGACVIRSYKESWKDDNLVWSVADYDGLDTLIISSTYLWVPDIFIFNTAGGKLGDFVNATGGRLKIQNDGRVTWLIPLMIQSSCKVDATYFPYDKQTCDISFGSWIYDENQLDLQPFPIKPDLSSYVANSEFNLIDVTMRRELADGRCCPGGGNHPMVVVEIHMKRMSVYYDYIVIAPTVLLSVLSLFSFFLPSHHGDKISIGLTVFLTLYVLQLLISENVPDTNTTPILGIYTFLVMTLNCTSLIIATVVMNVKNRAKRKPVPEVPPMLSKICRGVLGKITCSEFSTRLNKFDFCSDDDTGSKDIKDTNKQSTSFDFDPDSDNLDGIWNEFDENNSVLTSKDSSCPLIDCPGVERDPFSSNRSQLRRSYRLALCNRLSRVLGENEPTNDNAVDSNIDEKQNENPPEVKELNELRQQMILKHEWYFVAETLDKASFIVYVFVTFVTVITVLVIVPHCV